MRYYKLFILKIADGAKIILKLFLVEFFLDASRKKLCNDDKYNPVLIVYMKITNLYY